MKKFAWVILAVSVSLCLTACGKREADTLTESGYEQLKNLDYSGAERTFLEAVQNDENLTLDYRGLGIALMNLNRYEEAEEAFVNALANSGSTPKDIDFDINYYLGICYHKMARYEEAKERYDAILTLRPKEVDAFMQRGTELLYLGKSDEAVADFDRALSLKKKDYSLYIDIYAAMKDSGFQAIGVEYLNKALTDNDRNMPSYYKGCINYNLGNYSTAKQYLEQARTEGDKSSDLLLLLGRCYEELGDSAFAINLYKNYLESNSSAAVYNQLGVALMEQGDYEGALEAILNGIECDNNECRQPLLFNRVLVYEYLGDFESARDLSAQYIVDYPSDETMAREINFLKTR